MDNRIRFGAIAVPLTRLFEVARDGRTNDSLAAGNEEMQRSGGNADFPA